MIKIETLYETYLAKYLRVIKIILHDSECTD